MKNLEDFREFGEIYDLYKTGYGEGESMASQIAVVMSKIVRLYFIENANDIHINDGINWLAKYVPETKPILDKLFSVGSNGYADVLYELCEYTADRERIAKYSEVPDIGTIYDCCGEYLFNLCDYDWYEEEDYKFNFSINE